MSQTRESLRTVDQLHRFQWQPNCPTDLQKWQTLRCTETHKTGCQCSLKPESQKGITDLWCDEQQSHSTTDEISSSPRIPVSISELSEPHLFSSFILRPQIWHRGPRPKAHWYMCTDDNHYNYSPLIGVMPSSLITFLQLACLLE